MHWKGCSRVSEVTSPVEVTIIREGSNEWHALVADIKAKVAANYRNAWELGDKLISLSGRPGDPDRYGQLSDVARAIGMHVGMASKLRLVAYQFPPSKRNHEVPWEIHYQLRGQDYQTEMLALAYELGSTQGIAYDSSLGAQVIRIVRQRHNVWSEPLSREAKLAGQLRRYLLDYRSGNNIGFVEDVRELRQAAGKLYREIGPID